MMDAAAAAAPVADKISATVWGLATTPTNARLTAQARNAATMDAVAAAAPALRANSATA
jgi:hypothetical protein